MTVAAYPAARTVAAAVQAHFALHIAAARRETGLAIGAVPARADVELLIETAFWASLRREEGYVPKISLALLPPDQAPFALTLERPLPLSPEALTRVAPAVERPGVHLGVWRNGEALSVWGTTREIPAFCLVLEVSAPGLLVIKHHRGEEAAKFVNVAVLEGHEVKVIDEDASSLPDCPALVASLVGFDSPATWRDAINVLVEMAVSMRAHGRGALLLVVPSGTDAWRESIVRPIAYALEPPHRELAELVARASPEEKREREWQDALARAVDAIAGLTAVDGATVITDTYELLAFGAKVTRREGAGQVDQVMMTEPIEGATATLCLPGEIGGTRHLAGAQFAQDQRNAIALVASQDGRFTIFAWSPCENMVHAHRVETLLL